jgi:hypothetical protein
VGDQKAAGEALQDLTENLGEARRVGDLAAVDAVDLGRPEVATRVEESAPAIGDLAVAVDREERQLDDAVMGGGM